MKVDEFKYRGQTSGVMDSGQKVQEVKKKVQAGWTHGDSVSGDL